MTDDVAEREQLRARFADVGRRVLLPSVTARDRERRFDRALWRELAGAGLFRVEGIGRRAAAVAGLAEGSLDLGVSVSVCAHFVCVAVIEAVGTDAQKRRWLPKLKDGSWLAACANAEPGAGTDLMGLRSRVREEEAAPQPPRLWLTGRKRSVTNLGACDFALCSARIDGAPAREAVNIFGVESAGENVWMRLRDDLAGLRTSPTGSLIARRAPLSSDALIGARGDGVRIFRLMFSEERITTGHLYLAALRAILTRAVEHAERRQQFGQPIGKNQYVQEKIVRTRVAAELLENQLARTVADYAAGVDVHASLSIVKLFGVEAAVVAAQDLMRLLGSRGVSVDEPAERLLRDLLALSILGGTVELQKIIVYGETARLASSSSSSKALATAPAPFALDVVARADTAALEPAFVALVAAAFPDEPGLRGRWWYDTPPDRVVVARAAEGGGGDVAGIRTVVERTVSLASHDVRIAGLGIALHPDVARGPLWEQITARALDDARARGAELALTFPMPNSPEGRLREAGFQRLRATVTYLDSKSGALVVERMPCFALAFRGGLIDEIEALGALHLGAGTF